MHRTRRVSIAKFAVIGAAFPVLLYAISTGPPPNRTGAPGEGTCRECHDGGSGGGKVEIGFPGQMVYAPGVKQLLTVTITDSDALRYGFELSTRVAADNSQAGTLAPAAGESAIRVICRDFNLRPAGGCPASAPIEYIQHSSPRQINTFQIEWTPPASDVGPVKIYLAANAANGNGNPAGDDIYTANYTLTPQASVTAQPPKFTAADVLNSATMAPGIAPGAFMTIRGENLAPLTRTWEGAILGTALPSQLEGVSVTVGGRLGYLHYISPAQLNVVLASDDMAGSAEVKVATPQGSATATALMEKYAPAFFTFGTDGKYAAASHGNGDPVSKPGLYPGSRPAATDEEIVLWGTGFGPTAELVPSGQVLSKAYPLASAADLKLSIGGKIARVTFAGVALAGVNQINAVIPADLASGDHAIQAEIGGKRTQDGVLLTVQGSGSVATIQVSYRLDPWLLGSTYTGEKWVAPDVFGPVSQGGGTFSVPARTSGLDADGQVVALSADWYPADPEMVTILPSQHNNEVTLTVKRAGQSTVKVSSQGVAKELVVKATFVGNTLQVEITQN